MKFIMRLINNPAFRTFIAQYLGTKLLDGAGRITNEITDEVYLKRHAFSRIYYL